MLQGITYEEADPNSVSVQYDHPEYFWCEGSYTYRNGDDYVQFKDHDNDWIRKKDNREKVIESRQMKSSLNCLGQFRLREVRLRRWWTGQIMIKRLKTRILQ